MRTVAISTLLSIICFSFISGCNSMGKPKANFKLAQHRVTLNTQPEGADVVQRRPLGQSSSKLGKTPIMDLSVSVITDIKFKNMPFSETQQLMKHSGNVVVTITKEGYEPYHGTLRTNPSEATVHNIVLQPKTVNDNI